jgi:hypothetical protein
MHTAKTWVDAMLSHTGCKMGWAENDSSTWQEETSMVSKVSVWMHVSFDLLFDQHRTLKSIQNAHPDSDWSLLCSRIYLPSTFIDVYCIHATHISSSCTHSLTHSLTRTRTQSLFTAQQIRKHVFQCKLLGSANLSHIESIFL